MTKPICLFDSGIGGLTVLKKLIQKYPNENYIYLADLANVPYGDKTKEEIKEIATNNIEWLSKFDPKIIIMACNASSTVIARDPSLHSGQAPQSHYVKQLGDCFVGLCPPRNDIPIYGMIESCSKEIAISEYKKVSVWATKLVAENNAYKNAIQRINPSITVEEVACPKLVPMIEGIDPNLTDKKQVIQEYIEKTSKDSQALILGCTHYPLIQEDILKFTNLKIIDPADALVNDLEKHLMPCRDAINRVSTFYTTAQKEKVERFVNIYLCGNCKFNAVDLKKVFV